MIPCPYAASELLAHAPPMILIDEALGWAPGMFEAAVNVSAQSPFSLEGQGVPAYVGVEYMAQTCGLYAGFEARRRNQPVRIGFLLGTRNFHTDVDWFALGDRLIVRVCQTFCEAPMGVFDCAIVRDEREIASARLNVYQPLEDPKQRLARGNDG